MKVLSSQEQEKLLACVQASLGVRNAMIVRVFLFTGLRVSELCGLIMDDVYIGSEPKKHLLVRADIAKGGFQREVPLCEKLREDLRAFYREKMYSGQTVGLDPAKHVFTQHKKTENSLTPRQVQRIIKLAGELINIPDLHPHTLRHTFATGLMRVTDMRTVQALLGHRSLQSTQIYTHPDSSDLANAVNKL
jgi:site-specific recombinase XerD